MPIPGVVFSLNFYYGPWENNIIRNCSSTDDGLKSGGKAAIFIWNSSGDESQFKKLHFEHNKINNKTGVESRSWD